MSLVEQERPVFEDQPISQLLIKVASRCNIDCSYCYWFRDAAVYSKPKLMSAEVATFVVTKGGNPNPTSQTTTMGFKTRNACEITSERL